MGICISCKKKKSALNNIPSITQPSKNNKLITQQSKNYKLITPPSKKTIFWVDQNIKNEENQKYCSQINSQYGYIVEQFIDINSLFERMKLIKFDIVIIIISGKLIGDYLTLFKKQIDLLSIIPNHIIFTNHKDFIINLLQKEYSEDLNNNLINIENIASKFEDIKNLLNKYLEDGIKIKNTTKTVFWVDQNIKNEENQKYCSQLNIQYGYTVEQFIDINSLFERIKLIKFDIVIIISGKLIGDYLKLFKEQFYLLHSIPNHIIFTNHKDFIINLLQKEYSEDLNNNLINIENITSNFENINNLINKCLEDVQPDNKGNLEKLIDYNYCFSYEYIEKFEELILSSLYKKIRENKKVSHSEINNFNIFLLKNFGKDERINELIFKLIKLNFSDEIITKCWASVLTLKTSFFSSINWNLMQLKNEQYNTFVRILYSGLKKYSYKRNQNLFRGSIMKNNEMKEIMELYSKEGNSNNKQPKIMVCSKIYLFFSEIRDVAIQDIRNYITNKKEGYSSVLFELEINKKNNSNANLSSFSFYPERKEILFFPFSCFLIKKICYELNYTKIILEDLGIYNINEIICEYDIEIDKINKKIQILNSYEEVKRKDPYRDWKNNKAIENEKEIKENCEIYLNNKK